MTDPTLQDVLNEIMVLKGSIDAVLVKAAETTAKADAAIAANNEAASSAATVAASAQAVLEASRNVASVSQQTADTVKALGPAITAIGSINKA